MHGGCKRRSSEPMIKLFLLRIENPHLQRQAVVSRSFVFAAVVLAIIHVNMVQLQEAHKIPGRLQRARHRRQEDVLMHSWINPQVPRNSMNS